MPEENLFNTVDGSDASPILVNAGVGPPKPVVVPRVSPPPMFVVGLTPFSALEVDSPGGIAESVLHSTAFWPIGYLESGATIKYEPFEPTIPVFGGATEHSQLNRWFTGSRIALQCSINLFTTTSYAINLITTRAYDNFFFPPGFSVTSGFVGYNYLMLARPVEQLSGFIPVAGLMHYTRSGGVDYFLVLNARVSVPAQTAPIGGSSTSMILEVYSTGFGVVSSTHPKIGGMVSLVDRDVRAFIDPYARMFEALGAHSDIMRSSIHIGLTYKLHDAVSNSTIVGERNAWSYVVLAIYSLEGGAGIYYNTAAY
ncbi:MAG: hypothetical protein QXY15_10935 [Candidatus Nitrosotenuis sp.]